MEIASQIWLEIFTDIKLPKDGAVVEIAPGYEPKIGNALATMNFCGTIYLVEPDQKASAELAEIYRKVLPNAKVVAVEKTMQEVIVGDDIPEKIDAVVASHPFDDMVIGSIVSDPNFFTAEKEGGTELTLKIKNIYDSLTDAHYEKGIKETVTAWKNFLETVRPVYFIASQYPSTTLNLKGLTRRQESGYEVMRRLKNVYKDKLLDEPQNGAVDMKADPKWWITIKTS